MRVESSAAGPGARQSRRDSPWHDSAARDLLRVPGKGARDQAELAGAEDGLGAVGGAELVHQVADVLLTVSRVTASSRGDARVGHRCGGVWLGANRSVAHASEMIDRVARW
jgi:hypothetical protein